MFAENAGITGLSKVWSSLSCSNYPRYHSCGWKMKCFINLTHSCLLRPTTALYLGQAVSFPMQLKLPMKDHIILHLSAKRTLRLCIPMSVHSITNFQTEAPTLFFYYLQVLVIPSTLGKAVKWDETFENKPDLWGKLDSYIWGWEYLQRNNTG